MIDLPETQAHHYEDVQDNATISWQGQRRQHALRRRLARERIATFRQWIADDRRA